MRVTSVLGLAGAVVMGIIIADFLTHPEGTKAAGSAIVGIIKPSANALLGKTS